MRVIMLATSLVVALAGCPGSDDPCRTTQDCEVYTNIVIGGMQYPNCTKFGEPRLVDPVACRRASDGP